MASRKRRIPNDADISALHKEWDEISCPICMDHPHNAVLILCSSHEKGCRSFICDTSYRHSNCLDRFKKLVSDSNDSTTTPAGLLPVNDNSAEANGSHESIEADPIEYVVLAGGPGDSTSATLGTGDPDNTSSSSSSSSSSLKCPLCRGSVVGWEVVEEARQYLNLKSRSCSQESCSFSGNYRELRRHARRAHPTARPSDVDPTRERAWRRLEHQREYSDIVSAIRSAMPGAVVFGDYAIENGDNRLPGDNRERGTGEGGNNGHWWTAFFLFQMIGSMEPPPADRRGGGRPRVPTRHRRRRLLWGESLLGLQDDEDDNDSDDDPFGLNLATDNDVDRHPSENPRRRRRRLTRYRSDEDQS